ncbi:ATP-binding protein [Caldimonas caldifontis]|uniref:histidine kinase n=1 Tax=Caldimonas caldifontis TaxID=1452508 RepID=A0A2S5SUV3_9BURK|nr:ATP-binding protein [Caldimonas caldifontis]PPE66502.1 two-component sensor histidine kinase [Caldimonas caldifontis]
MSLARPCEPLQAQECPRARSLKVRLLVVLFSLLGLFWLTWVGCFVYQFGRQQTGVLDKMLSNIGTQVLLSMPAQLGELADSPRFSLPAGADYGGDKISFQAWDRRERVVMASPDAPTEALKPDFSDGFAETVINGERWRVYAISDATGQLQVQVGKPKRVLLADVHAWTQISLISAVLVLILLKGAIWGVVHWSFRPVGALREALRRRQPLDLQPLPVGSLPSEVRPLVESFNGLLGQLDTTVQAEKRFIADAAHELRTPLAGLLAHAELAATAQQPEDRQAALQRLTAGVKRSARLSEQLLDLARLDASHLKPDDTVELFETVALVTHDFEAVACSRRQRIGLDLEPCSVHGQVDALGVLVRNLIDNALRYTPEGGRCEVSCKSIELSPGDRRVRLRVADNGPGVPEHERHRIFDRFYRVPGTGGRGSGIGLSLVARIAQLHGAMIGMDEGLDGRGFAIWIDFQATPMATSAQASPASSAPDAHGTRAGLKLPQGA